MLPGTEKPSCSATSNRKALDYAHLGTVLDFFKSLYTQNF